MNPPPIKDSPKKLHVNFLPQDIEWSKAASCDLDLDWRFAFQTQYIAHETTPETLKKTILKITAALVHSEVQYRADNPL